MANAQQMNPTPFCDSIARLLERRAEAGPGAAAIAGETGMPLSYRRLLVQAQEVARALNAIGVGRGDRVAAVLPNGPEMATAFVTISAVAAFAPLNPEYRSAEFEFFLSDLKPTALVVRAGTASAAVAVARSRSIPVIELLPDAAAGAGRFTLKGEARLRPLRSGFAGAEDTALILHTSGTTSQPKMVPLTHGNLLVSAGNIAASLRLTEGDRCLGIMPLFHIHGLIGAVLSSVVAGASVVCTPEFRAPEFIDWLEQLEPTWYTAVPTMHQAIAARARESARTLGRSSLRFIRSCSAPLPPRVSLELEELFQVPVIEAYGMTEASHQIASNPLPPHRRKAGSVGIATGTEISIMGESGKFLPSGETGEIVIRGSHVTRGYEADPATNAAAFANGWFRTGDLGYLDADGYLFITGRLKEIINRGGEKISPAEVDRVLTDHPAVAQAVTFAVPHGKLGEEVAAAVVLRAGVTAAERELREFAALRLAEYKVPRLVAIVDEIPKGATGKVQRLGLAARLGLEDPDAVEIAEAHEYAAPRSAVEKTLAQIWSEILRVGSIGIHDNFFDLGGDSILASMVIARVGDALGAELSFLDFFEGPSLAQMAERIDHGRRRHPDLDDPPLVPVARDGELPLSFAQQRIWFFDQLEPGSPLYNRSVFLRLRGRLDEIALRFSLSEIVRRHEVIRTTFPSVDGRPRQRVLPPSPMTVCTKDLRGLPDAVREVEARRLAVEESLRPFDLTTELLLRANLLQLGEDEHILILTSHHIAFDGWSDAILFREISALYTAYAAGLPSPLPELPIQYGDFAVWQRAWLQERTRDASLDYWKRQLAGAPSLLDLPTDRPRPRVRTFRGARHLLALAESLTAALTAFSRREGVTLYMSLLAAFNVLLGRCSGQSDIVVGTPVAGRARVETEKLIGAFMNTLVLRTDLSGNPSFRELLRRVREVFLAGHAHSDVPIAKLVEALQPERDMASNPLFQVMFQLRNMPEQTLALPGVVVEEWSLDSGVAKLDLTLEVIEKNGRLKCCFCYNTDLFNDETIARMAEHYQTVLEALVTNPEHCLFDALSFQKAQNVRQLRSSEKNSSDFRALSNLTENQLLFWAGQKLQADIPIYNVPYALYVNGEIEPRHFQKAFQTLVNSSDALRTVIREIHGIPQQFVLADLPYEVEFRDFSSFSEINKAVQDWLRVRSQKRFDLEKVLFDCALAKISDREFVWYWNVHHIITDSRSLELTFRYVSQFYEQSLAGRLNPRVDLPSFKDYVEYEKEYRHSVRYRQAENYWKTKLEGAAKPLSYYGKRSEKKSTLSRKFTCELGVERTLKLRQLASREEMSVKTERASMFNIFAGVLLTYLYRVTGERIVSVGVPFHNRRLETFRNTIGLLMEVLPLRIAIERHDTFMSLSRKIASEAYSAFRNCHSLGNSRESRLYDVLLNYDLLSFSRFNGLPVRLERIYLDHETHSIVLRIRDYCKSDSLVIDFEFHRDVFDESDCQRAIEHFVRTLDAFLDDPCRPVEDVNLLSHHEKEIILRGFSRSYGRPVGELALQQLIEAQVRKTPNHPAVFFEGACLSYAELSSKANQLANYLRALQVKPGEFVGICTERCPEMIVGVMGALKAGAAYVPLDPAYPRDRLDFMIRDTRMPVLLSQSCVAEKLPGHGAKVVCLDSEWGMIARMSEASPGPETTPNHPAYVIYTSGSTGRPKGVEVSHGALANFVLAASEAFALGADDRVLQFASLSFDASVEEIFPTLVRGATLVLRTDSMLDSVAVFLERCREWQITVLDLPTAYWHQLTEALPRERLQLAESLRLMIIGGERAVPDRVSQWQNLGGGRVRLLNTYGPTEATVVSTVGDLTGWESGAGARAEVPIGRPISNVQTYVLDGRLNPVPIGVCGELYVAGAGLARGYVNSPDLTGANFIPNPFSDLAGGRLYRTGDLARYLSDGDIEFVGRADRQLKIRGFRIEPGEIEAALRRHPSVRDAAVAAPETAPGERQLVGYLVSVGDGCPSVSELRQFLQNELPGYMIPTMYMELESLPLTVNGKIDREALPAPGPNSPMQDNTFVPPSTAEENAIATVWAEVLRLDRVGVRDNFFDLGGHSLLAIQVVSRLRGIFKMDLPLRALFEHPTVAALAGQILDEQAKNQGTDEMVNILSELETLSDDEAQRLLKNDGTTEKDRCS
jgi:amino acid adenylation domain-containing protein